MATVSDLTTIPWARQLLHINALLDTGPDWNYLTSSTPNTIYYTFSVASGNEDSTSAQKNFTGTQQAFTNDQQASVDKLLEAGGYLNQVTGINFVKTTNGNDAQIHFCNVNLIGSLTTGLCSWQSSYQYEYGTNNVVSYDADAYVYLDNVEFGAENADLTPGKAGFETLLHEMGHALGLKHSFYDPTSDNPNPIYLPESQDNTSNTLMSYKHSGGPHATYSPYDIAALNWLYGQDGLGGKLGINSQGGGRYITGTAANDTLEGYGGNDMIDGGPGADTVVFHGARSNYTLATLPNGDLQVASIDGIDGVDTLRSIEILKFSDMSVSRADVVDTVAPDKPTLVVTKNVNGYTTGNTPLVTGRTEAGAIVKIFTSNNQQVGTATADANGLWTTKLAAFADGLKYQVYATATDAAGNVSQASDSASFDVDATPPVKPTYSMAYVAGDNQATLNGTGEAGTTIELVRANDLQTIARTTVGSDGKWQVQTSPLPNGDYSVKVISIDLADNATNADTRAIWSVNSAANLTGTSGNDVLKPGAGNNAVDGGAGIDTAVYAGSRSNFTIAQEAWGFGVTDKTAPNGSNHDALINVERVQFDDAWVALDIDGIAGQIFRLYTAVLGRPAEAAGMGYWMWRMEGGTALTTVAREFMNQPEFDTLYGTSPTDTTFVTKLYNNVLHRNPDAAGFDYWLGSLSHNSNPDKAAVRTQMLIDFSDSLENQANVVGTFQHGIDYTPWHQA
ncbi:DUF4214 domain-containing protein [Massilia sp. LXY-6]|uniref:DUF4214 domain-containing protein n=1 Tax=Massilia sp. LXY-6 TaxID=3379823 RepID=UPI003EE27CEA